LGILPPLLVPLLLSLLAHFANDITKSIAKTIAKSNPNVAAGVVTRRTRCNCCISGG
jgi:hypothetical protein